MINIKYEVQSHEAPTAQEFVNGVSYFRFDVQEIVKEESTIYQYSEANYQTDIETATTIHNKHLKSYLKPKKVREVEKLLVTVDNIKFDADEDSQNRMMRNILTMDETDTVQWITSTDGIVNITKSQLEQALKLAVQNMSSVWVQEEPTLDSKLP